MSMFPVYLIEPLTADTEEEKCDLIISGKTHIKGILHVSDFNTIITKDDIQAHLLFDPVFIDMDNVIHSKDIMESVIDRNGGEVSLFIQYRRGVCWFIGVRKEDLSKDGAYVIISRPHGKAIARSV